MQFPWPRSPGPLTSQLRPLSLWNPGDQLEEVSLGCSELSYRSGCFPLRGQGLGWAGGTQLSPRGWPGEAWAGTLTHSQPLLSPEKSDSWLAVPSPQRSSSLLYLECQRRAGCRTSLFTPSVLLNPPTALWDRAHPSTDRGTQETFVVAFPGQPAVSDPAPACAVTMLSCYLWSPLSSLHRQTCANQVQVPEGHPVCGHLDAPSDPDLLELLSEPQAVGTGPWTALLEFHSYLRPQRPELSAGAPGVCCSLTQSVSSGQDHGLPQQCWGVREGHSWGSDGCGSDLAPRTPRHDRRNLTSCVCEQP